MEDRKEPDYFRYYNADVRKRKSNKWPLVILIILILLVLAGAGWFLWSWFSTGQLPIFG